MAARHNTIVALCPTGSDMLSVDVDLDLPGYARVTKTLARQRLEKASRCLDRIRLLFARTVEKGVKTNTAELLVRTPEITVSLSTSPQISAEDTNDVFWSSVSSLTFGGSTTVQVLYNIPTVVSLTPPAMLAVGTPASCSSVKVLFAVETDLEHQWWLLDGDNNDAATSLLCSESVFVPPDSVQGRQILYRCRPCSQDSPWTEVKLPSVRPRLPVQARWTASVAAAPHDGNATRFMTYNILHDDFCTSKFAKLRLYPFATDEVLSLSYRKHLISQEVGAARPDIVCLQECGASLFDSFLQSALGNAGLTARYHNKSGKIREGCVTAFRASRFDLVRSCYRSLDLGFLREVFPEVGNPVSESFPHLADALQRVTTIGTVTVLRDKRSGGLVVVGNTHLFYHPYACHIRTLQTLLLLQLVAHQVDECKLEGSAPVSVVLCGDFNFTRVTGGYALVTTGAVHETNSCWDRGLQFWWGVDRQSAQANQDPSLWLDGDSTAAGAASSSGTVLTVPPREALRVSLSSPLAAPLLDTHKDDSSLAFTNYSLHFKEIIDHIFVSDNVRVLRTVPMPSVAEVTAHVAIPSPTFPSDHLPLVCDVVLAS